MGVSGAQSITPGGSANSATASALEAYSQVQSGAPTLPSYFGYPFTIIVSPFVPFDPATKLTDLFIFDRNELGALVVDEEVTTEKWRDPTVDIQKLKLREKYGIAIFNEGLGIGVIKNAHVVANQVVLPAQTQLSVSGSIAELPATTAVV